MQKAIVFLVVFWVVMFFIGIKILPEYVNEIGYILVGSGVAFLLWIIWSVIKSKLK